MCVRRRLIHTLLTNKLSAWIYDALCVKIVHIECVHSFRFSVQGQQKLSIDILWGTCLHTDLKSCKCLPLMKPWNVLLTCAWSEWCATAQHKSTYRGLWICESWWLSGGHSLVFRVLATQSQSHEPWLAFSISLHNTKQTCIRSWGRICSNTIYHVVHCGSPAGRN